MPRVARKNIETPFLHVMVQGVNKEYIFYKEKYIKSYLEIIGKKMKDYDFEILAYCIMNNHAHFLVYAEDKAAFGKFMQRVNLIYAQMYNKEEKRCGVLFRNRYQSESIEDERYLLNCIKYIHENPVKAGIVDKCEYYKYSSYNDYMNNIGVSQSNIMKKIFGKNCDFSKMFKSVKLQVYMDIDDREYEIDKEYISVGINDYLKINHFRLNEIYENITIIYDIFNYLNNNYRQKNVDLMKFFDISKKIYYKSKKSWELLGSVPKSFSKSLGSGPQTKSLDGSSAGKRA